MENNLEKTSKKIAILGFGIEGKDAAKYFAGEDIAVFDKKAKEEIAQGEWADKNITWITGENYLENGIEGFDIVVRSPGFYRYQPAILDAEKNSAKITSNTIIFFENSKAPIIGVTGTKGKGTTSSLISHALESAGKKVLLAGNIGEPMLSLLPKTENVDWVVLELSSFQIIDVPISPKIVVITNITTDHMDWHKDQEEYEKAKENLWLHQTKNNSLILNYDDPTSRRLGTKTSGTVYYYSLEKDVFSCKDKENNIWLENKKVGNAKELKLIGPHNQYNALAALIASTRAGTDPTIAWKAICKFEGLEHRLEHLLLLEVFQNQ